ncbi:MAG: hypothetical protein ACXVWZ_08865 [Nocardioides sp.]
MNAVTHHPAPPPAPRRAAPGVGGPWPGMVERLRRAHTWPVLLAALVAALAWTPFVTKPVSADEGGFLLVASQWGPGTSLYGDYWVDRPPLLIALFELAHGPVGLRLLGIVCVAATVLLAGRAGRLLAPFSRWAPAWAAGTAAVFMATPLFGTGEVDGEVLAVPFVMAGVVAALQAYAAPSGRHVRTWWFLAGVLGACGALVKQNLVDVFVVVAVAAALLLRHGVPRAHVRQAAYALVGGVLVTGLVVVDAATRGTSPLELWDALVTFRFEAARVINDYSTSSTPARGRSLAISAVVSGAVPLVVLLLTTFVARGRRGVSTAQAIAVPLLAWEAVAVVGGGSYWLHYLVGTVPGLVVAAVAVATHSPRHRGWLRPVMAWSALVGAVALGSTLLHHHWGEDRPVEAYLLAHARPGDTGVMAFTHPNVLYDTGLASPYEELWSLPVRVRDPRLTELAHVLASPARPTWVIQTGSTLATWGVDDRAAEPVLQQHYHLATVIGGYYVYVVDGRHLDTSGG